MSTTTESPAQRGTKFIVNPRDGKRRKMQILRPADDTQLVWLNCLTTNALICCEWDEENAALVNPVDAGDFGAPAPDRFRTYMPEDSYEIGEFIYHQTWRDVGRVIGRRELPGSRFAIDVAFLNTGLKALIVGSDTFVR
ncbi:MAG: hypothetical protein DHS20C21_14980 [Gemmatimonadota bacterium]|nr:MAG: hypothetical protein DHS20C21_14980 [Gemmatimonadota bacterium]